MAAKKNAPPSDLPKLAAPAMRALNRAGLTSLAKLSQASEAEAMELHGMGPNAMAAIRAAMKRARLTFAK
ncbi:MAG: hypothetical protein Q8R02_01025 [Hyphomonadaceae bacterium]|nr:hypothetical protein [Hyphomonadaceae bacterium]